MQKYFILFLLLTSCFCSVAVICPETQMCMSQWGYCGYGDQYCGSGCHAGACYNGGTESTGNGGSSGTFSGHGTYYDGRVTHLSLSF